MTSLLPPGIKGLKTLRHLLQEHVFDHFVGTRHYRVKKEAIKFSHANYVIAQKNPDRYCMIKPPFIISSKTRLTLKYVCLHVL